MRPSEYFDTVLDDQINSARGVLADADRFEFKERLKASLEAELALYSNLKQLIATGVPPPATPPVDSQLIASLVDMLDRWTDRVLTEADYLPEESVRSELRDTLTTADVLRAYLRSYPVQ